MLLMSPAGRALQLMARVFLTTFLALSLAAGLGLAALDLDEQMALTEAGPQALAGAGLDPEEFCALPFELNGSALCAEGRWQLLQHSSG